MNSRKHFGFDGLTTDMELEPSETSGTDRQLGGTGRYSKMYPS